MVTTTGDLPGNVGKLKLELSKIKFPVRSLREPELLQGEPSALLPVLHYVLLNFSKPLAKLVVGSGYELNGKTDLRFLETVWKLLREMLGYKPALSINQFLSQGFAERKVLLLCDVISKCKHRHNELLREAGKPAGAKRRPRTSGVSSGHIWASPGEEDVPSIVHRSPPLSATRAKKKQMRNTPPHLKAPRGQVEVVSGSTIAVQVLRGQPDLAQTVQYKYAAEPDAGHPLMASAQSEETEEQPRAALPVFWTPADEQLLQSAPPQTAADTAKALRDTSTHPAVFTIQEDLEAEAAANEAIEAVDVQGVSSGDAALIGTGNVKSEAPGLETLVKNLADQLHDTTRRLLEVSETSERREQTLQARITILEGRVRFLEGAVEEQSKKALAAAPHEAAPAPRVTATGRLAQRRTSPSPKRPGMQTKAPALAGKAITGRVPAVPVVAAPRPWEESGEEVVASAVSRFGITETPSFQEETVSAVPLARADGLPAAPAAQSAPTWRSEGPSVAGGAGDMTQHPTADSSVAGNVHGLPRETADTKGGAETTAFISSIAGRFEAARALLDSL